MADSIVDSVSFFYNPVFNVPTFDLTADERRSIVNVVKNSRANLLVLNTNILSSYDSDIKYSKAEVGEIKTGLSGRQVLGYMSVGEIIKTEDILYENYGNINFNEYIDNITIKTSWENKDESRNYLKIWEIDSATNDYYILPLLKKWADNLKALGVDGVYLDVMDIYSNENFTSIASSDRGEAIRKITNAYIEIVDKLNRHLNTDDQNFQIALGTSPDLLMVNENTGGAPTTLAVDAATKNSFKSAIDYVFVESWVAGDLNKAGTEARRIARNLGMDQYVPMQIDDSGNTESMATDLYAFGDAKVFALTYHDGGSVSQAENVFPPLSFMDNSPLTWGALYDQIVFAKFGIVPYASPYSAASSSFARDHLVFNKPSPMADALLASSEGGVLSGLGGSDLIYGREGRDVLYGGAGFDRLYGEAGRDTIYAGNDDDRLYGGNDGDRLYGNAGHDSMFGESGNDVLYGGDGADALYGSYGTDSLVGESGNDRLDGGIGTDTLRGGLGDDKYYVDSILDTVLEFSGEGNDTIFSYSSTYNLFNIPNVENLYFKGNESFKGKGNNNNNVISGGSHGDALYGYDGNDTLFGAEGNDTLLPGRGYDRVYGGDGADAFVFNYAPSNTNIDRVMDFRSGTDRVMLLRAVFPDIGPEGVLKSSAFVVGSAALQADDRIIFDKEKGYVYYDQDGSGSASKHLIFYGLNNVTIRASDFDIY